MSISNRWIGNLVTFAIWLSMIFEVNSGTVKLAISHFNDFSAQVQSFEPGTYTFLKAPMPCDSPSTCIGGIRNVIHWMFEKKGFGFENVPEQNILRLSSGNIAGWENGWLESLQYCGSVCDWYSFSFGHEIGQHLRLHALSLGIKDFGKSLSETNAFIEKFFYFTNDPIRDNITLANTCDILHTNYTETERWFCNRINPSVKKIVAQTEIGFETYTLGVIGFVNPLVERLSHPGKLVFNNVVQSITTAIEAHPDINMFIVLGDGDLDISKSILDNIPKVKLVIFGSAFSNTPNTAENYLIPYKQGFIATAGKYGSSVGKLVLEIDTISHNVTLAHQQLVTTVYPERYNDNASDGYLTLFLRYWTETVAKRNQTNVGHTAVDLKGGEHCWSQECNLGNLMADAAVNCIYENISSPFMTPLHSVWHGAAFVRDLNNLKANITQFDIQTLVPFVNSVHLVRVEGSKLRKLFEKSATTLNPSIANETYWGQFLQVSNGIKVEYSLQGDVPTVSRITIRQSENRVPKVRDLEDNMTYYLVIPTYLYEGRGIYEFAADIWTDVAIGNSKHSSIDFDYLCMEKYVASLFHVTVGLEERISITGERNI